MQPRFTSRPWPLLSTCKLPYVASEHSLVKVVIARWTLKVSQLTLLIVYSTYNDSLASLPLSFFHSQQPPPEFLVHRSQTLKRWCEVARAAAAAAVGEDVSIIQWLEWQSFCHYHRHNSYCFLYFCSLISALWNSGFCVLSVSYIIYCPVQILSRALSNISTLSPRIMNSHVNNSIGLINS